VKAQVCRYMVAGDGKWQRGIMIGTESDETAVIVNEDGKLVAAPIYDFKLEPHSGCFETKEIV
jgi:hypothetical protein